MCVMWNSAIKGQVLKKLSRDRGQQPRTLYSSLRQGAGNANLTVKRNSKVRF